MMKATLTVGLILLLAGCSSQPQSGGSCPWLQLTEGQSACVSYLTFSETITQKVQE